MENQKLGIQNVKEVLEFGYELLIAGKDVFGNGLDLSKLPAHLIPLYNKAIPAFDGIGGLISELSDLDVAEAQELVALISSKGVASEHVQDIIKKSLDVAISAYNLVKAIKA
jgi:hypothetical protein